MLHEKLQLFDQPSHFSHVADYEARNAGTLVARPTREQLLWIVMASALNTNLEDSTGESDEKIAVVIPCFNEAKTIRKVVTDFALALPSATIYVFDNNSVDGTGEIAREAGATVIHSPRQGKGNVLRQVLRTIKADVYVIADGDDTYPAHEAPGMIKRFQSDHLDMLVGVRLQEFEEGSFRRFHQLGNRLITGLINLLFRTDLRDVLSGYRILSPTFARMVRLRHSGFEVETEMTLQALTRSLAVAETPIAYGTRPDDSPSKLNTWGDGLLILKCIALLFKDYRPLMFFSGISAMLVVMALVSGSAPIRDFIETGYVLHVPRAILAAGLAILSMTALTAGLILDTVVRLHEESIEFWSRSKDDER